MSGTRQAYNNRFGGVGIYIYMTWNIVSVVPHYWDLCLVVTH